MNDESRFISGIHNWCDRWCERCPQTSRCRVFDREEMRKKTDPDKDWAEVVSDNFKETLEMLQKMAGEMGIDMEAAQEETESYQAVEEAQEIIVEKHPLNELANQYIKQGRSWIDSSVLSENLQQWQSLIELGTLDISEAQANLNTTEEALEVIRWYLFFIAVKIKRALRDQMDDFWEEYPDEERSDLGTAKIASIAIERSMEAWETIFRIFPHEEQLVEILAVLQKLRKGLIDVFPNFPKFIRPGFDNQV